MALPLDHETDDILAAATEVGRRLERPLLVVHALERRRLEGEQAQADRVAEAKEQVDLRLEPLREAGLDVSQEVAVRRPADLLIETEQRVGAELVVTGGGRPATVRRWLVGSVAESIVRAASVPVWVARGTPPVGQPILCPVDLSPQSRLGLASAIRMARAFGSPLRVMTVVPPKEDQGKHAVQDEALAREQVEGLLAEQDLDGLDVSVVVVLGSPAERIVDAGDEAGLLVIGSRGFDPLIPDWLGPVTSRALRYSRCSMLTVREVDLDLTRREHAIASLAHDYQAARRLLDLDGAAEALPILESAAERAPANAAIQEAFALALERVGRHVEARGRREIAAMIRTRIGSA
ncbi:MAG: universal stress protein [Sandaracinaceae bacterium]|nr:universal stress protein [Sandaracinaceae bacterium]